MVAISTFNGNNIFNYGLVKMVKVILVKIENGLSKFSTIYKYSIYI